MTQDELKEWLRYYPRTGHFVWLKRPSNRVEVGSRAGTLHRSGYWRIQVCGKLYEAHRLAFLYMTGALPERVDHRNLDGSDCRRSNLRLATRSQNGANRRRPRSNTTGFKGVVAHNGGFQAQIGVQGRVQYLGRAKRARDAYKLYKKAAREAFSDYARV